MFPADEHLVWRKSSRSGNGASCVEVAFAERAVLARDSKDIGGGSVGFGRTQWAAFLETIKAADR